MPIASGINKLLIVKKQTGLNAKASAGAAGTSRYMRRVTSTIGLKKATYQSNEKRPSQQKSDMRHGTRSVEGTISGEVSVGTYQQFEESINRALVVPSITLTAAAGDINATVGTLTTTANNFITQGFRVGMVIRASGFTTTGVANNGANLFVVSIAANGKTMNVVRLDGVLMTAKTETGAVTLTEVGKHSAMATTNFTRDYYTIEQFQSDVPTGSSEVFTDCVVTQMDVKLPGSGMMTVDYQIKGLDMSPQDTQYFTSPAAAGNGAVLASANGLLYVNGVPVALITGMNFSVKGNHASIGGVVGSNVEPDIFPGAMTVDGQITVLFSDATMRDYFLNETEVGIYCVFTTNNTPGAGFKAYSFPRCKMGGADRDDSDTGLVMTMPFTALENVDGGTTNGTYPTSFAVQDSAFV